LAIALLFAYAASPVLAQAVPAATQESLPFAIGAGFSAYNPYFGHGHLLGGTLWIDYAPHWVTSHLRGLSLEVEARDLNYGRSSQSPNLREDTAEGGLIYSWPRFRNIRPYGKISAGYGNRDAESPTLVRYHDSRNIWATGGGLEFKVSQRVWVRADYEYQLWPNMVFALVRDVPTPIASTHPQGLTVGALYHFRGLYLR
jgi:opacity protein-like surface antigen